MTDLMQPLSSLLKTNTLILGSSSPRRSEILDSIGLKGLYKVMTSDWDENLDYDLYPKGYDAAIENGKLKAIDVFTKYVQQNPEFKLNPLVIGCDTVVFLNNKIIGKPKDAEDAKQTINSLLLSQTHQVFSGVGIAFIDVRGPEFNKEKVSINGKTIHYSLHTFYQETTVHFQIPGSSKLDFSSESYKNLVNKFTEDYVNTKEPFGRAGSYGYQGISKIFIKKIDGDPWNVIGFPAFKFVDELANLVNDGSF